MIQRADAALDTLKPVLDSVHAAVEAGHAFFHSGNPMSYFARVEFELRRIASLLFQNFETQFARHFRQGQPS
jgi:hypothetical protein